MSAKQLMAFEGTRRFVKRNCTIAALFVLMLFFSSFALAQEQTNSTESDIKSDKNHRGFFSVVAGITPAKVINDCIFKGCRFWEDSQHDDPESDDINIHIIPHSHTDAGWIEPIDWYYENWVKNIFSNIFDEMYKNKNITFVWADTNYLYQWFESQDNQTQQKVFEIIKRGQLEFVGGGWVQNDESLSDLKSIINQMNLGLQYLHQRFNATPTVGWQIDPFGYNRFMPSVFKELGYKYLVLNRIGDTKKESYKQMSGMDFWLEPAQLGQKQDRILTHVLSRHYEPKNYDDLIKSIPSLSATDKVKIDFVKSFYNNYVREQRKEYASNELMILMGKDFGFRSEKGTLSKIENMNQIITQYSKQALGFQINCTFSLPSVYFKAIEKLPNLKIKQHDFLNYDERLVYLHPQEDFSKIDYWIGYYRIRRCPVPPICLVPPPLV